MDPVRIALETALTASDSPEVRLALAKHLLEHGDPAAALAHAERLLVGGTNPDHLRVAAAAAEATGDTGRAAAYRLALGALQPVARAAPPVRSAPPPPARPPPLRVVGDAPQPEEVPTLRFADVGGLGPVKERLDRSFLLPLRHPELHRQFGKTIAGGVILYGPPGCGKTYIARALAGEIGARFLNVSLGDVIDIFARVGEKNLQGIFENARRTAPTVLFFDEIDAVAQRRTDQRAGPGRALVNLLLSELDGVHGRPENLFYLAATNHPWDLDNALRRPGRFDQLVFVPPPAADARRTIVERTLTGLPAGAELDPEEIVQLTRGFSGADVVALLDQARERAFAESVRAGALRRLGRDHVHAALRELRPSVGAWIESARNYALYGNEGGIYDDLLAWLRAEGHVR